MPLGEACHFILMAEYKDSHAPCRSHRHLVTGIEDLAFVEPCGIFPGRDGARHIHFLRHPVIHAGCDGRL